MSEADPPLHTPGKRQHPSPTPSTALCCNLGQALSCQPGKPRHREGQGAETLPATVPHQRRLGLAQSVLTSLFFIPHSHLPATQHKSCLFLLLGFFLFSFLLSWPGSLSNSQRKVFIRFMNDDIRPNPRHAITSDPAQPSITAPISLLVRWPHASTQGSGKGSHQSLQRREPRTFIN